MINLDAATIACSKEQPLNSEPFTPKDPKPRKGSSRCESWRRVGAVLGIAIPLLLWSCQGGEETTQDTGTTSGGTTASSSTTSSGGTTSGGTTTSSSTSSGGSTTSGGSTSGGTCAGVTHPTLSEIQSQIFDPSCATAFCHGSSRRGGLDLRSGSSYSNLVHVDPTNSTARSKGYKRVLPGDTTKSFLVHKLRGTLGSGEGSRMPPQGALPEDKIQMIEQWICDGAPNN